jgi:hypothetical protein
LRPLRELLAASAPKPVEPAGPVEPVAAPAPERAASAPAAARVGTAPVPAPVDPVADGLHVCPSCRGELVQPREWRDSGPEHWMVERVCPECWWTGEERHDQETMEAFDLALDDGTDLLIRSLHTITAERMQDDVERFAAALEAGAVLPEDF